MSSSDSLVSHSITISTTTFILPTDEPIDSSIPCSTAEIEVQLTSNSFASRMLTFISRILDMLTSASPSTTSEDSLDPTLSMAMNIDLDHYMDLPNIQCLPSTLSPAVPVSAPVPSPSTPPVLPLPTPPISPTNPIQPRLQVQLAAPSPAPAPAPAQPRAPGPVPPIKKKTVTWGPVIEISDDDEEDYEDEDDNKETHGDGDESYLGEENPWTAFLQPSPFYAAAAAPSAAAPSALTQASAPDNSYQQIQYHSYYSYNLQPQATFLAPAPARTQIPAATPSNNHQEAPPMPRPIRKPSTQADHVTFYRNLWHAAQMAELQRNIVYEALEFVAPEYMNQVMQVEEWYMWNVARLHARAARQTLGSDPYIGPRKSPVIGGRVEKPAVRKKHRLTSRKPPGEGFYADDDPDLIGPTESGL